MGQCFSISSWRSPDHNFGLGTFSGMPVEKRLKLHNQDHVTCMLMSEIEERDVPELDKAIEMTLKSIEMWNHGNDNSETIENALVSILLSFL